MNSLYVIIGSAVAAIGATVSVISIERADLPPSDPELLTLTRRIVASQEQFLREQEFLRLNVIEMVEAQQQILHRDKQRDAKIRGEVDRSKTFFEQNMGIAPRSP